MHGPSDLLSPLYDASRAQGDHGSLKLATFQRFPDCPRRSL